MQLFGFSIRRETNKQKPLDHFFKTRALKNLANEDHILKCNYLWSIKSFICLHLNSSQWHRHCNHHYYVVLLLPKAQTCLQGQKFLPFWPTLLTHDKEQKNSL